MENGKCLRCSKRYYVEDGKCIPVNPLCQDYNEKGACTSCYRGYSLNNGRCTIAIAKDPNCKSFVGGLCSECYKGFYFHSYDKACKRINPLCKSSNRNNGACTSCYPGYNLNANSGTCEVFFKDPNCKKFDGGKNCL